MPFRFSEIIKAQGLNSDVHRMIRISISTETPPNQVNLISSFSQKRHNNRERLEVVNSVLYKQFFDNVGNLAYRQTVVPPEPAEAIIATLQRCFCDCHFRTNS